MTEPFLETPESNSLSRPQVLVALGVTAAALLGAAKVWQRLGQISLLNVEFTGVAWAEGFGVGLGITAASAVIYRLWPAYRRSADFYLELVLKPLLWPDLIWLALLPGLSEELLFRGVMLPAIGLTPIGVILSSLCFGILHLSNFKQWPYVIWATLVGLVLGFCTIATGNLLIPVVAHVVTNLLSGCFWKWEAQVNASKAG